MTTRYGVNDAYSCGARTVQYSPSGCQVCLEIKLGEKQIFTVDFGSEVKCNPTRVGCRVDYNELESIVGYTVTPETVFSTGTLTAEITEMRSRSGEVDILVDATDAALGNSDKWAVTVSVEMENGRVLKECFYIQTISCGNSCYIGMDAAPCTGDIIKVVSNCNTGTLVLYDEVTADTACVEVSPSCDAFYTLDGTDPSDMSSNPIPIAGGNSVKIFNPSEINGFRMQHCDGDCNPICASRTYRKA